MDVLIMALLYARGNRGFLGLLQSPRAIITDRGYIIGPL
jgi:hypothetical protein